MIHITIIHNQDGTHYIESIYNLKPGSTSTTLLAKFDNEAGKINLDVLEPFLGEEANIIHHYLDGNEEDYAVPVLLTEIAVDTTTGLKYMSYVTK